MVAAHAAACVTIAIRSRTGIVFYWRGRTVLNLTTLRFSGIVVQIPVVLTNAYRARIENRQCQYVHHAELHGAKVLIFSD